VKRVVVTGLGAVTPVGNDVESTWQSLIAGRSGIVTISTFDPTSFKVRIAGLVEDFELSSYLDGRELELAHDLSRAGSFGVASATQAIADAGIADGPYEPHEKGLAFGSSVGRPELKHLADMLYPISEQLDLYRQPQSMVFERDPNLAMNVIAELGRCNGPMINVSTACTASAHAIGEAFRRIQEEEAKLMLVGGFDALTTWLDVLGFSLLGALTDEYNDDPTHASRPFAADRSGFVLGEGAITAVLEEREAALARGAKIYGEIAGYSSSLNAYRITDAPPDGGGAILAMESALHEAGLGTDEIDYVAAHGTGTPGNDFSETLAIKKVFGDDAYKLAISSAKSMTGHMTAASGGLSLLVGCCAMRDSVVPPTINLENPDPKLDLDYISEGARERKVRAAMLNAFAFGGTNASLVIRDPQAAEAA
jgi:3-oxoacyl-[acyl-carrier-protein] synthase II